MTHPLIATLQPFAIATLRVAADAGLTLALIHDGRLVALASGWKYLPPPSVDVVAIQWRDGEWGMVK